MALRLHRISHNNISLRYKSRSGHLPYGGCPDAEGFFVLRRRSNAAGVCVCFFAFGFADFINEPKDSRLLLSGELSFPPVFCKKPPPSAERGRMFFIRLYFFLCCYPRG